MRFLTDKQTLDDLNIIRKQADGTVFHIYNRTHTRGGAEMLEQLFLFPLADAVSINNRSRIIECFAKSGIAFPFPAEHLDGAEDLMGMTDPRTRLQNEDNSLGRKLTQLLSADEDYKVIYRGVTAVLALLADTARFVEKYGAALMETPYRSALDEINGLLNDDGIASLLSSGSGGKGKFGYAEIVHMDDLMRFRIRDKVQRLLRIIYQLDVYISVGQVAIKQGYAYPEALDKKDCHIAIGGLYHPLVKQAIDNDVLVTPESNVIFLTGANMAGKSTFMKSLGIALYLAHMGFPVAAKDIRFCVLDGIYTTINLPDDLGAGNSHFYAEVMRVKKVAKELAGDKNLLVIFDELFRGTNVKDAYEGTVAITEAFAERTNSVFVISTHIIEAGDVLRARCRNIRFLYLPTRLEGNSPVYTYKLEEGITSDRHGMVIINNEKILDILRRRNLKAV